MQTRADNHGNQNEGHVPETTSFKSLKKIKSKLLED